MSVPLYSLRITAVGEYVECSLRELRLILFSDAVPDDIASYCAVHQASELTAELSPGQQMKFNDKKSKSLELGNKTALEYVQRELNDKYNLSKELFEIDSNIGDYDKLKERVYKILSEKIGQEVDSYWINTEEMDIYFGGGTAQKMKIYNGVLIEAPQMATAKGLYVVGTKIFR